MCLYYILMLPIAHKEVRRVVPTVRMLAYRHRHCGIGLCQNISPMPLAKNRTDFLRTAMRVLRSNNFARRIQSFPWKQILPHHLIITDAKRTARFFPRCPLIFFLYLILPIAHKEVRRVVPTVRMLAYRHRHCGIGLCQNISPMPLAKNRTDFLRTAMRVLRSNNFARRIQSFPWKQILPHHLIITDAKRTARFFPRCPLIFFLYLILPIAHKEVRRVVPAV